jgi:hydroxyacylglutathione hydrolase
MLLKYFYDKPLSHASYLVGCQKSGEALVIDPGRCVDPYLESAAAEGLRIVAAAETHIHADFVSGSRELADRAGAKLHLSEEGPADWKYQFADRHDARLLKNGDTFHVGLVKLEVVHTPGHTPESISYLLTDEGGGATAPMGIFTGDFVFVGAIGRPDLLETAVGVAGSAEHGARQLYRSIRRFRELPDHLQVWPAHGAGSACGKGLGSIPSTTAGYEKLFNPAMQFADEQEFVEYVLADQPETPSYFAVTKRMNKVGPPLIRELPPVALLDPASLDASARDCLVVDPIAASEFAAGHVPGTINIPAAMLVQWAGYFVDYDQPVYLITDADTLPTHLRSLRAIGIDRVGGYFDAGQVRQVGLRSESYPMAPAEELHDQIAAGQVTLIDVRAATEFSTGHISQAEHRFLGTLLKNVAHLDRRKPIVAQCQSGARSAIASSILQQAGFNVTNLRGGYRGWVQAGLPFVRVSSGK